MEKTIRVGQMPGRIEEYAVETGTTISALLELANLDASGFDVKVDGNKVTDLDSATVTSSTNLVILAKQVKGNAERSVRVGQMPGRINEFAVDSASSIADLLALAELDPSGFDVKVDGNKVTDFSQPVGSANLVILAKQVKGNNVGTTPTQATYGTRSVRVGQMPGRIQEYAVEVGTSIAGLLQLAELDPSGFDVKVDGNKVTDLDNTNVTTSTNLIILAKQVKGNN